MAKKLLSEVAASVKLLYVFTYVPILQDGPGGFFRGYVAFLARDLPFDAIEFVGYEQIRILYLTSAAAAVTGSTVGQLTGLENSLLGAIAGGLTGALTTPLGIHLPCIRIYAYI